MLFIPGAWILAISMLLLTGFIGPFESLLLTFILFLISGNTIHPENN